MNFNYDDSCAIEALFRGSPQDNQECNLSRRRSLWAAAKEKAMAQTSASGAADHLAIAPRALDEVIIATSSFAQLPRAGRADYPRQLKALLRVVADKIVSQRMVAARTEIERGRERLSLPRRDPAKG